MIFIILPAYNEEHKIGEVLEEIDATLSEAGIGHGGYRVILVNDGSTDDTLGVVRRMQQFMPLEVIDHGINRGVHEAFRSGFNLAVKLAKPEDIIFTMDADGTHDVSRTPEMIERIRAGWDIVIASRFRPGSKICGVPFHRNILSYGARFFVTFIFRVPGARDFTIFHRAYRARALKELMEAYGDRFIEACGFTSNAEILIKAGEYFGPDARICEVPCELHYEIKAGPSKMKVVKNIIEYFKMAWRIKFGPRPSSRVMAPGSTGWIGNAQTVVEAKPAGPHKVRSRKSSSGAKASKGSAGNTGPKAVKNKKVTKISGGGETATRKEAERTKKTGTINPTKATASKVGSKGIKTVYTKKRSTKTVAAKGGGDARVSRQ